MAGYGVFGRLSRAPMRALAATVGVLILVGFTVWSVLAVHPRGQADSDPPATVFGTDRAMTDIDAISRAPHPTGSPVNDEVRDYLLGALDGIGVEHRVQSAFGANARSPEETNAAYVDNIVATIPGTDPTGRLYLAAHYDTAQFAPGAGDDSTGVAVMLEVARALTASPPLRNDVVLLFTDAEESGGIGSEAFVSLDPLAADGGVVLNLEARGSGGPVVMFETSDDNAALAALYAETAPQPVATSAAVEVYRRLRNNTDFTNFLAAGDFTGLNTAFFSGAAVYHTPQDVPARLDRASVHTMGVNTLALTRALGDADLHDYAAPAGSDATYFPVLGALVHYSDVWVWPLGVLGVVALFGYGAVLRLRAGVSVPRLAAGTAAGLIPLLLGPLAVYGLWHLLIAIRPGYGQMLDLWRPMWFRLAAVALAITVVVAWLALCRRRIEMSALVFGALVWPTVFGLAMAAFASGMAYLGAVPALIGALAGLFAAVSPWPVARFGVRLVAAVIAVLVLAPAVTMFLPSLGMGLSAVAALFVVLACLVALPILALLLPGPARTGAGAPVDPGPGADPAAPAGTAAAPPTSRRTRAAATAVPAIGVLVTGALVVTGLTVDVFDREHPEPAQLMYGMDPAAGTAQWFSEHTPSRYTERYVHGPSSSVFADYPYLDHAVYRGTAELAELSPPRIDVVDDRVVDGTRELTVFVQVTQPVRLVTVAVFADAPISAVRVEDRDLGTRALGADLSAVTVHAPPADGVTLRYRIDGDGPVRVRVADGSDGVAQLPGFRPMPDDVDLAGTHSSGLAMVAAEVTVD